MRPARLLALALLLAASTASAQPKDLARARALDKEGAKAYGEGRYADAIRFFDEAYRLGGPAFELWNVAKCHLRLDQPEQAADLLERYLATPNLPKEDREEAGAQLDQLKKRSSTMTVSSSPPGAAVSVDGKAVEGRTPLTVTVAPGAHTVTVSAATGASYTHQVEARYGRSLIVDAPLTAAGARPPPPPNPYERAEGGSILLRAAVNIVAPRFGRIGGSAGPGFLALGTYRIADLGKGIFSVGGMFTVSGDRWKNETGVVNDAGGKCNIRASETATAFSFFGTAAAGFPLTSNLRAGALVGAGITGLTHDELGSDVFLPDCDPTTGAKPAFVLGAELDYAIGSVVRVAAFPLTWHLQPSFDGTRSRPRDATAVWMRFGVGIGVGVDL